MKQRILAPQPALIDLLRVKNLLLNVLLAFVLLSPACVRAESGWATDYKKAQEEASAGLDPKEAKKSGVPHALLLDVSQGRLLWDRPQAKVVRIDPTGRKIYLDKGRAQGVSKNLVLVEIDFPHRKAQSTEIKKQNVELAERYQVEGFPTLVVLNGDGKTVWRYDGYYAGGVTAFLAELDKARKG